MSNIDLHQTNERCGSWCTKYEYHPKQSRTIKHQKPNRMFYYKSVLTGNPKIALDLSACIPDTCDV